MNVNTAAIYCNSIWRHTCVFLLHLTPIDPFKILHTGPLNILIFVCQSPDSPGSGLGGGSLGLLLGVCTLQILMKPAMSMMRAMPISNTAHQWACRGEGNTSQPQSTQENNVHVKHCRRNRELDAYHDPLCDVLVELGVEDGLLQPGQRSICVHQATFHEHVAVTLEVVARRARRQRGHFLIEEASQALRAGAAARVGIHCWDEARSARFKSYSSGVKNVIR